MKKRLVAFLLVLIMVLGMLPVSAMAAGSVVTARGSAENPIRIYENSGNQAETSNGSVQVPVGETVTDSGVLTFSTYSAIEGVQVSKGGVYCAVTSSNENVVKATGSWSGGVLTINFLGVGNGTAKITVDYTCTCSKNAVANGLLIYNVTVGDGGSTDPSGKPNAPTASDIGAFPDAGKAVLLHCVDAGARGHDATASSLNKVQNGYSVGEVVENPGTYYNVDGGKITKEQFPWMCVVTVHAAPFIELYNSNFSERYGVHKLAGTSNATATLHWFWHNTYGWQYLENPPIQFNITRDTSEKTYTLNYYKNTTDTVTNMPEPNPQTEKSNTGMVTFTVSSAIPAREGYNFLGWNGKPDATEPTVMPGNTITTPRETTNLYAVWESKTPPPESPGDQKPNIEEANAKIRVQCTAYPSKHNPYKQNYRILPGSYDDLGWDRTEYGYIYSIRLNRAKYIAQFDQEIGRPHTDTEPNVETRINWRWENGAWHLIGGPDGIDADIKVKCAETPVKPDKPTALDGGFAIVCKNNKATHPYKADYIATPSQYTISDVQKDEQGYYVTATVTVAPNLVAYNKATRVEHRLVDEQDATLTITFRYDTEATVDGNRKWKQQGDLPVVEVICEPEAPTADELKKLEMAVQVKCVVDAAQQHTSAYGLLGEYDKDYFVGEPKKVGDDWLCDISYDPDPYVAAFNKAFPTPKHIQNDEKIVPVTLIWVGGSWQIKTQGRVLVTEVYTVTFDSYGGTPVPPAQEVEYGLTATEPATAPTKTGYTFDGWYLGDEKYDFSDAVEQNITLYANWKKNIYTVTYTDGVDGEEVFADQVYENLLSGIDTPAFNGTPTRDGYRFTGWEPEVSDTVTGNVTYAAQWTPRTDLSYTVHYYLKNTTKQVADDKTVNGQTFNADVTEKAIRISGYRVYGDSVKSITIGTGTNEIIFYYTRASRPSASSTSKPTLNTGDHYAYVMGYPDGTVRPNGSITRAEVSAILFRLLSDKTRDEYFTTESSFTDVKAGAWYNNSIATLEKAGVIVDTAKGGAFRPNEAITRAELAAMLAQFSDAKPVKGVKFSDVSAEHWAYEAIAIAAKMGWIEGYPDGTFRPDATITRAEMMTLVNRALERVPSDEDHLLSKRVMLTFPDCKSGDWFYIAVQEATNSHTYERAATEKNGDEQWTALRANRDWTLLEK